MITIKKSFFLGVMFSMIIFSLLNGVLKGIHTFLIYWSDERLIKYDALVEKVRSGWKIRILRGNTIFNCVALAPNEDKIFTSQTDGLLVLKVRVSENILKANFPSADIRILDAVWFH